MFNYTSKVNHYQLLSSPGAQNQTNILKNQGQKPYGALIHLETVLEKSYISS